MQEGTVGGLRRILLEGCGKEVLGLLPFFRSSPLSTERLIVGPRAEA